MPRLLGYVSTIFLSVSHYAAAGIDSGGGRSSGGNLRNHCSIGSPFGTDSSQLSKNVNHSGIIELVYIKGSTSSVPYDPDTDLDHDGSSNFMEFLAGTDPGNASSVFRPQGTFDGRVFRMPIPTIANRNYHVWASRDLKNWIHYRTMIGNGEVRLFEFDETTVTTGPLFSHKHPSCFFFRIQIAAPEANPVMDTDQDGISDQMEFVAGTVHNSAASVFRPQGIYSDGLFRMPIPTLSGRIYQVWASRDLQNWSLFSTLAGNDSVQVFEFDEKSITSGPLLGLTHPSSFFFRIHILIP